MPIYEYQCTQCNERHEIIQRISDAPLQHCPKCSGPLKKLFSSPAIQFKGSGFYKTDYASGSAAPSSAKSESSKSEGGGAESKAESKSDSKSDTKSDATTKAAS